MLSLAARSIDVFVAAFIALLAFSASAQQREITFAGFAYTGDASTREARFPYSVRYEVALKTTGETAFKRIDALIEKNPPKQFRKGSGIDDLKANDQAIVTALVVTNETTSIEHFGSLVKLLVLVRAQALFFDFKSQSVLRAYPISFAFIDVLDHSPTSDEVFECIKKVYQGADGKPGIFERYASVLAKVQLPTQVPRFLQVTDVTVTPEVLAQIPDSFKASPTAAQTWLADLVSEAVSSHVGVPILPFSAGYAVNNVMTMQVSDGDVYNLQIPKPDYGISVELSRLKKVKFGDSAAGSSFIYGSFATVKIIQPLSGQIYFNSPLKNGETKVVPATQTYVEDFPAFYDSVNGLFSKLADAMDGKGGTWIKSASASPDIEQQVAKTKELMQLCK